MRDALNRERGFAAARRAKELDHAAARKSAAQRFIERAETGWEEGLGVLAGACMRASRNRMARCRSSSFFMARLREPDSQATAP